MFQTPGHWYIIKLCKRLYPEIKIMAGGARSILIHHSATHGPTSSRPATQVWFSWSVHLTSPLIPPSHGAFVLCKRTPSQNSSCNVQKALFLVLDHNPDVETLTPYLAWEQELRQTETWEPSVSDSDHIWPRALHFPVNIVATDVRTSESVTMFHLSLAKLKRSLSVRKYI